MSCNLPKDVSTIHVIPTITDNKALNSDNEKITRSEEPNFKVTSPYVAAKIPIVKVDIITNEPKYKEDFVQSCNCIAGSTPKTPPGPAIP